MRPRLVWSNRLTRKLYGILAAALFMAALWAPARAFAQSGGDNKGTIDTTFGEPLRPRQGTYILETYPSPATNFQKVTVQFYNKVAQDISVEILDDIDRVVRVLQETTPTAPGLHSFRFPAEMLASGTYSVRLTIHASAGGSLRRMSSRFLIIR